MSSSTNGNRISFIISFFEHLQIKILHSNRISSIIFFFEHLQGIPVIPLHYVLHLHYVSAKSHQGSFNFVFSSMNRRASLSIVSRTFDLNETNILRRKNRKFELSQQKIILGVSKVNNNQTLRAPTLRRKDQTV